MKKRVGRRFKVERGGKGKGNGEAPKPKETDVVAALGSVLDTRVEGLAETYDFLRLLGAVTGQIALLDVATQRGDPKAQASAARALITLKEKPEHIVERLRSSKFNSLDTQDLAEIVEEINRGKDPQQALQECLEKKA